MLKPKQQLNQQNEAQKLLNRQKLRDERDTEIEFDFEEFNRALELLEYEEDEEESNDWDEETINQQQITDKNGQDKIDYFSPNNQISPSLLLSDESEPIQPPVSQEHFRSTENHKSDFSYGTRTIVGQVNESLMAQALEERNDAQRSEILRIAYQAGVAKDDPLFAVMLALGIHEQLLTDKPLQMEQIFDQMREQLGQDCQQVKAILDAEWNRLRAFIRQFDEDLERKSQAALDVQAKNVSDMATVLVRRAALKKVALNVWALIFAGTILFGALAIGLIIGLALPLFASKPELDPTGPRQLTLEQAQAMTWGMSELGKKARGNPEQLKWALSAQGRYARQFMAWNELLLSERGNKRLCEQDAQRLGVTLTLDGRVAKGGFCTLWTQPPNQRRFAN